MRFGILGPLEVVDDDGIRREPSAQRQRRLLLALLVLRDSPVNVDQLVEIVWPTANELPRTPARALRTYVSRLRQALEPEAVGGTPALLVGGPDRFQLVLEGHELDADLFEADLAAARRSVDVDPEDAQRCLERGLARWRGTALSEVADEAWAQPEAVRLDELRLTAQELRYRCLLEGGRHDEALTGLERHIREHPLRERPHGQLMVALHRSGRTADAAEVYRAFRERLAEDVGLDPSVELEGLHQRLLDGRDVDEAANGAETGRWNQLPETLTPLVGRGSQLDAVADRLASVRVLTLTGVGGVGKTRLAIEAGREVRDAGGQVIYADLSLVTDGSEVIDAVFGALRLTAAARSDHLDGLVRVLRSRPALLVIDNCEHVLDAVAGLISRITRDCPDLTVLATSREAIGIDGEHVHRVPSLGTPAGIELFRSRAAAVMQRPPEPAEFDRIEEICRGLDGIPLAIELAAARASHMTVSAIADHLDERFWLLTGGRRAIGRHQTLQATMDWSYDLLDEDQRAVLRAAAVFVGGFDASALAAITERDEHDILDRLGSLVSASLVDVDRGAPEARYRLLETVRIYAQERLAETGESTSLRRAHAEHFLSRALAHPARIVDAATWGAIADDDGDLGNHLAALDWFDRQGELTALGRMAARLSTVLGYSGYVDVSRRYLGRDDISQALGDRAERGLYLTASARDASYLGHYRDQLTLGEAAMQTVTDPMTRGIAAVHTANAYTIFAPRRIPDLVADTLPGVPESATAIREQLRSQEPLGLVMEGRLDEAAEMLEGSLREDNGFGAAELMLVRFLLGDHERALEVPTPGELSPEFTTWDYRWSLVRALIAAAEQRPDEAGQRLADAADRIRTSPIRLLDRDVLLGAAALAHHRGEHRRASELLAVSRGMVRTPASYATYTHYRDLTKKRFSREQRASIIARAEALTPGEVLEQELARLTAVRIGSGVPARRATQHDAAS